MACHAWRDGEGGRRGKADAVVYFSVVALSFSIYRHDYILHGRGVRNCASDISSCWVSSWLKTCSTKRLARNLRALHKQRHCVLNLSSWDRYNVIFALYRPCSEDSIETHLYLFTFMDSTCRRSHAHISNTPCFVPTLASARTLFSAHCI